MNITKSIINIGVEPKDEANLVRKKHINNQVSFYTLLAMLFFLPYLILIQNYFFIPVLLSAVAVLSFSFVLNSKSYLQLSHIWRFSVGCLLVFFASIEMPECGFEYFLIPLALIPIILSEQTVSKIGLFLISLILFFLSIPVSNEYYPHFETTQTVRILSFVMVLSLVFILCALFVFKYKQLSGRYEQVIQKQLLEIEEKNNDITDSINYAKRLQQAILPPFKFMNQHLQDFFLYYAPKDIVAGDFYWMEKVEVKLEDTTKELVFVAAADCTGHGVPGALVSMICSNALSRAVKEFHIYTTGNILDKVRDLVLETFEKSDEAVMDGMDISLMAIDFKNQKVQWSGANNSLFYGKENQFVELKANKQPIGRCDYPAPFVTHTISYETGTNFYLYTDGYADQFGGPQRKKFKRKQLFDVLEHSSHLALKTQGEIIKSKFEDWKGELTQMDDVCVIGIKL